MKKISGLSLILLLTAGCAWFEEHESINIIGKYDVGWNELESNRAITKKIEACNGCSEIIIENYVFGVGHNEKFIIAKQHLGFDTTKTLYYLIDLEKNTTNSRNGIVGPLNEDEFKRLKKKLQIAYLDFNMKFNERPKF